jgi:hypothetical protein
MGRYQKKEGIEGGAGREIGMYEATKKGNVIGNDVNTIGAIWKEWNGNEKVG